MNWILITRQGWILMDNDNLTQNIFTELKTLQQWIGLTHSFEDMEGHHSSEDSIITEKI